MNIHQILKLKTPNKIANCIFIVLIKLLTICRYCNYFRTEHGQTKTNQVPSGYIS